MEMMRMRTTTMKLKWKETDEISAMEYKQMKPTKRRKRRRKKKKRMAVMMMILMNYFQIEF